MKCQECPVVGDMPCHPGMCGLAVTGKPIHLMHIVNRSRVAQEASKARTFPPITTQVGNALESLQTFLGHPEVSSREEQERRLSICRACENFQDRRCILCGCRLWLKVKGRDLHCPINKW